MKIKNYISDKYPNHPIAFHVLLRDEMYNSAGIGQLKHKKDSVEYDIGCMFPQMSFEFLFGFEI